MDRPKSLNDILCGLIFIGFGLAFGVAAGGYEIGSALRMGPGFFPLTLAVALGLLGAAILVKGVAAAVADGPLGPLPWRGLALILGAVGFFGATVRGLGLGPSLFVTAFLAALASRYNSPFAAAGLAAGLTAACLLIFTVGLGVPLPVLGPWLGR